MKTLFHRRPVAALPTSQPDVATRIASYAPPATPAAKRAAAELYAKGLADGGKIMLDGLENIGVPAEIDGGYTGPVPPELAAWIAEIRSRTT